MTLCQIYLEHYTANFYQNQPSFAEVMRKMCWLTFHSDRVMEFSKNTTLKF